MFRNVLLVYSEKITEKHLDMVKTVMRDLERLKIGVNAINVKYIEKRYFENIDLAVTIGGDGTFIRTSHFLKFYTPILGINSEPEHSEGALLVRYEDLEKILSDSLYGETKLKKIDRIQTVRNNIILEEFAINEVYIGTEKQFTTSRYIVDYRGNKEEHRSSGVLVVTPSGSRSWYKSAGGKPFGDGEVDGSVGDDKKLKFLVREPYFGKIYNPKILNGEILLGEKIVFYSRRYDDGIIAIDSYKVYPFNIGDIVEIKMSDIPLKVVCS